MLRDFITSNITVNSLGTHMLTKVGEWVIGLATFLTISFYTIFDGVDSLVGILIALMVIDYITGMISAFNNKTINSKIGLKGATKKFTIFMIILTSVVIDRHLNMGNLLATATIVFYMLNEGLSILENAGKVGIPIPKKLQDTLEQMRKENDNNEDKQGL